MVAPRSPLQAAAENSSKVTSKIISGPKSNATNASDVCLTNTMGDGLIPDGSIALKINTSGVITKYCACILNNSSTTPFWKTFRFAQWHETFRYRWTVLSIIN